jgi:hypothetical protein
MEVAFYVAGWALHIVRLFCRREHKGKPTYLHMAEAFWRTHQIAEGHAERLGLPVHGVSAITRGGLIFVSPPFFDLVVRMEHILTQVLSFDYMINQTRGKDADLWGSVKVVVVEDAGVKALWTLCVKLSCSAADEIAYSEYDTLEVWSVLFGRIVDAYLNMRLKDSAAKFIAPCLVKLNSSCRDKLRVVCELAVKKKAVAAAVAAALVRRQRAAIGVGPHLHMESSLVAVHIPCDLVPHVWLDARLGEDLFHVWAEGGAEILAVQRKGGGGELGGVGEGLILPERGPWE